MNMIFVTLNSGTVAVDVKLNALELRKWRHTAWVGWVQEECQSHP